MKLHEFDYKYPEELVAKHPLNDRDASKMMVVNRASHEITHSFVKELPSFLKKGDVLVINNSRVFPARLIGKKESGGAIEILLLNRQDEKTWKCITNRTAKLKIGSKMIFAEGLECKILSREGETIDVEFNRPELIESVGLPPLPPYIRSARGKGNDVAKEDVQRYQTVYARETGSAAAPTAGLHFTDKLLENIKACGVEIAPVTLHVGLDTFSPVREENIEEHKMHGEEYFIPEESAKMIVAAKKEGRRVIAVGTTSARVLESFAQDVGTQSPHHSSTNIFIYPGYKFKIVDAMLTNFHQPMSTLIMMVSAFAGREFIMKAYAEAIAKKYRLFSYGDCMLIF